MPATTGFGVTVVTTFAAGPATISTVAGVASTSPRSGSAHDTSIVPTLRATTVPCMRRIFASSTTRTSAVTIVVSSFSYSVHWTPIVSPAVTWAGATVSSRTDTTSSGSGSGSRLSPHDAASATTMTAKQASRHERIPIGDYRSRAHRFAGQGNYVPLPGEPAPSSPPSDRASAAHAFASWNSDWIRLPSAVVTAVWASAISI